VSFLGTLTGLVTSRAATGIAAAAVAAGGLGVAVDHANPGPNETATEQLQTPRPPAEVPGGPSDAGTDARAHGLDVAAAAIAFGREDVEVPAVTAVTAATALADTDVEASDVEVTEVTEVPEQSVVDADAGRAEEVHAALTGGEELRPGDEGFGAAVAANARSGEPGEFGRSVAAAASGGASEDRGASGNASDDRGASEDRGASARSGAGAPSAGERPAEAGRPGFADRPDEPGRPEGTPPEEGSASQDGLERADEARTGEGRPGRP
jgi:hypothetical protein